MGDNRFIMVSEWMTNGNINEFIKMHPNVNLFELVGLVSFLMTPVVDDRFR